MGLIGRILERSSLSRPVDSGSTKKTSARIQRWDGTKKNCKNCPLLSSTLQSTLSGLHALCIVSSLLFCCLRFAPMKTGFYNWLVNSFKVRYMQAISEAARKIRAKRRKVEQERGPREWKYRREDISTSVDSTTWKWVAAAEKNTAKNFNLF